ncbi:hypothetical protein BN946_scf184977.g132 [Trametes cinnabarina]|uniref:Uncharacterized protein n=1 Tax=Pycnoporus cinnabarinus TaxID=5643 RepID=A0A060SD51_PYCCI|nr:hypothetical protein BN946_scf184977.g132 [Trametes cinnabarina]
MLKRRRSSPSLVADSPYAATPEPTMDVFERVAKRRRPFTRSQGQERQGGSSWRYDDTDGEEDVDGDDVSAGQEEHSSQDGRLHHAGEYRRVNSLLHDLHAEQRHRMIFSSSLPPSQLPTLHHISPVHSQHVAHYANKTTPVSTLGEDISSAHSAAQKPLPSFTISIPSKDASVVDHVEVRHVEERYADMNSVEHADAPPDCIQHLS